MLVVGVRSGNFWGVSRAWEVGGNENEEYVLRDMCCFFVLAGVRSTILKRNEGECTAKTNFIS